MKIMLIFRFFKYIWFIDSENLCFILMLKEKNGKVLTCNIVHFPNFEISAAPNSFLIQWEAGALNKGNTVTSSSGIFKTTDSYVLLFRKWKLQSFGIPCEWFLLLCLPLKRRPLIRTTPQIFEIIFHIMKKQLWRHYFCLW